MAALAILAPLPQRRGLRTMDREADPAKYKALELSSHDTHSSDSSSLTKALEVWVLYAESSRVILFG